MVVGVGLIINPDAGKDIRRLLSLASYVSNFTKVELGKRVVAGLDAAGVDEIYIMHDNYGLGEDVYTMMYELTSARLSLVETKGTGTVLDTLTAAKRMADAGVKAVVVVGGDGTLRAVFKACGGNIPLVCVAAGTNNVTGAYYDATLAGYAAGLVACNKVSKECISKAKSLEVKVDGRLTDVAVIDVAVTTTPYVGARALFDIESIRYAVFSKGEPTDIGLASILGFIRPVSFESDEGYFMELGSGGRIVKAIVMPGVIKSVSVKYVKKLNVGESVELPYGAYTIALDGERELEVNKDNLVEVKLTRNGPLLINVGKVLRSISSEHHVFQDELTLRKVV